MKQFRGEIRLLAGDAVGGRPLVGEPAGIRSDSRYTRIREPWKPQNHCQPSAVTRPAAMTSGALAGASGLRHQRECVRKDHTWAWIASRVLQVWHYATGARPRKRLRAVSSCDILRTASGDGSERSRGCVETLTTFECTSGPDEAFEVNARVSVSPQHAQQLDVHPVSKCRVGTSAPNVPT